MRIVKYAFYCCVLTYHVIQAHANDNFTPWITSQNQLYIMGNMGSLDSKNHHTKQSEVSKDLESKKDFSPTAQNDKRESQNENAESQNNTTESTMQWIENFTQEFRDFIDSKYKEHFSPEQILGYIYAVLFHKDYREKYLDFLKIDFPKIPFVESKEKFLALSDLGLELLNTHLMADITEREREQKMMRMTCNIGLVTCRQVVSKTFTHAFIAHTIMEMCHISNKTKEGNYLFPLYLYKEA